MSSIGASCAHVYVMKRRQEEKLKSKEARREPHQDGRRTAEVGESTVASSMVGKSGENKVHPAGDSSPPADSPKTEGQTWNRTGARAVSRCNFETTSHASSWDLCSCLHVLVFCLCFCSFLVVRVHSTCVGLIHSIPARWPFSVWMKAMWIVLVRHDF